MGVLIIRRSGGVYLAMATVVAWVCAYTRHGVRTACAGAGVFRTWCRRISKGVSTLSDEFCIKRMDSAENNPVFAFLLRAVLASAVLSIR